MTYNWQQKDWTVFRYELSTVEDALLAFAERTGRVSGLITGLPEEAQTEAIIDMMVAEGPHRAPSLPERQLCKSYRSE